MPEKECLEISQKDFLWGVKISVGIALAIFTAGIFLSHSESDEEKFGCVLPNNWEVISDSTEKFFSHSKDGVVSETYSKTFEDAYELACKIFEYEEFTKIKN